MSSPRGNQPTSKVPTLQIDAATFQAAVTAAVAAVMAQFNANNASRNGSGADNTDNGNIQEHQRVSASKNTSGLKPTNKKRKFWNMKERHQSQKSIKRQQPMATPTIATAVTTHAPILATGSTTQTSARPYEGSLPKCAKCSFHHTGACRILKCDNCNRKGHTTRFCKVPTQYLPSITSTRAGPVCYSCGEMGHFKRKCPTKKNDGGAGAM